MAILGNKEVLGDNRLTRIAQADTKKLLQKPKLLSLYLILIPTALGVEWTSGFDSSMMNSLQAVKAWDECQSTSVRANDSKAALTIARFQSSFIRSTGSPQCHLLSWRSYGHSLRPNDIALCWSPVCNPLRIGYYDGRCCVARCCSEYRYVSRFSLVARFRNTFRYRQRFLSDRRAELCPRATHHDVPFQCFMVRRSYRCGWRHLWYLSDDNDLVLEDSEPFAARAIPMPSNFHAILPRIPSVAHLQG